MQAFNYLAREINVKFKILGLMFVNVVINYMDRANISVAAADIGYL